MQGERAGLAPLLRWRLRRGGAQRFLRGQVTADDVRALPGGARIGGDRGSSAIELAILAPALLIISALIIQWALWFQARGVALSAAQQGARYARQHAQQGGWQAQASSQAAQFYSQVGTRLLSNPSFTTSQQGGGQAPSQVYVTVRGQVLTLIPGAQLSVTEKAGGPVECFRPAQGGGANC